MHNYHIVVEKEGKAYGAYSPDVSGCVAVGKTPDEAREYLIDTLETYIKNLTENGEPIPEPISR